VPEVSAVGGVNEQWDTLFPAGYGQILNVGGGSMICRAGHQKSAWTGGSQFAGNHLYGRRERNQGRCKPRGNNVKGAPRQNRSGNYRPVERIRHKEGLPRPNRGQDHGQDPGRGASREEVRLTRAVGLSRQKLGLVERPPRAGVMKVVQLVQLREIKEEGARSKDAG